MRRGFSRMKLHCFDRAFFPSSHSLNAIQLPAPTETHLWYVKPSEVKSESLLKKYLDILSPCERENVLRLQGEELRKSALLARTLVRTTIARSCGVTIYSQIGIDVEEKHRSIKHKILAFARRYFSKYEVQFLDAISDPLVQQREFIKLWTLKEAYVKALGKGFSGAPFKTFTIRYRGLMEGDFNALEDSNTKEIVVDSLDDSTDATSSWNFLLVELAGSHYAAICTEKHSALDGKTNVPGKLMVWKTIPFLEDEYVSGTDAVKTVCGLL